MKTEHTETHSACALEEQRRLTAAKRRRKGQAVEERQGEVKPDTWENQSFKWFCHEQPGGQSQGLWGCPASSTMLRM